MRSPHLNRLDSKFQTLAAPRGRKGVVYWLLLPHAFHLQRGDGLEWLECGAIARLEWARHGFSLRRGGSSAAPAQGLNLGFTLADSREAVEANRLRFFRALGVDRFALADLQQVHSARACRATRAGGGVAYISADPFAPAPTRLPAQASLKPEADTLVTDEAEVLLAIRTADCLPILVADSDRRAIAAVHAGWRGTLAGVAEAAIAAMGRAFRSSPPNLVAALGPSIRSCCYEVGPEVEEAFRNRWPGSETFFQRRYPNARPMLDLAAANLAQLHRSGVPSSQIHVAEFCTACRTDLFFSHRKEGARTGRMMSVIGIKPP